MRPNPLLRLLQSVQEQLLYPDEIWIVDGSTNDQTRIILEENTFKNLNYFLVPKECRGLTKQRNYGIERVATDIEIVCFLDDDTVLEKDYFEQLLPAGGNAGHYAGVLGDPQTYGITVRYNLF